MSRLIKEIGKANRCGSSHRVGKDEGMRDDKYPSGHTTLLKGTHGKTAAIATVSYGYKLVGRKLRG